jgi:hypothetical protein
MTRDILHGGASSTTRSQHSLRTVAEDIAIERGECVAEAFFHMAAVRSLHPALRAPVVTCRGAAVQDQKATDGAQAAHLLPGQILIGAQPIWALAEAAPGSGLGADEVGRLSPRLQMCFAKTNSVPAHFNRADSQAEKMAAAAGGGLKNLFADAVRALWENARVDAARPLVIDRGNVIRALGVWFSAVNGVYRAAEQQKRAAVAREREAAAQQRRSDEADVLAAYADSFRVAAEPTRFVRSHLSWIDQVYRWL